MGDKHKWQEEQHDLLFDKVVSASLRKQSKKLRAQIKAGGYEWVTSKSGGQIKNDTYIVVSSDTK